MKIVKLGANAGAGCMIRRAAISYLMRWSMRTLGISLVCWLLVSGCGSDDDGDGGTGGAGGGTATISGSLLDGGGSWTLPLECSVHTYYSSLVNPSAPDFGAKRAVSESVSVDAWPKAYELTGVTASGASWYIAAECDANGDGTWDVGGWYPAATPTLVSAPASGIDITILP
jgi:hypothetical protein